MSEYHELGKPEEQRTYRYPIGDYNEVVELYNTTTNDCSQLVPLKQSRPFMHLYRLYSTWLGMLSYNQGSILMALALLLVPLVNIGVLGWLIGCIVHLFRQYPKHKRNIRLVPNPFEQFVQHQQLCQRLGKHHAQLQLNLKDIDGFTFNRNLNRAVMDRSTDGLVDLIIYDRYFHDSYYNLRRHQIYLLWWLVIGVLFVTFSVLAYVQLITRV